MVCHSRWPVDVTPTWNQRLPYSSISEFNLGISIKIPLGGENSRPAEPAYTPFTFFYFCLRTLAFKCVFWEWDNGPLMHQDGHLGLCRRHRDEETHPSLYMTWDCFCSALNLYRVQCYSRQQVRSMTTEQREEHSLRPVQ